MMNQIVKAYESSKARSQKFPRALRIKSDLLFVAVTLSVLGTLLSFLPHKPLPYKVLAISALIVSSIALYRNHKAKKAHTQAESDQQSLNSNDKPIDLKALKQGLGA